MNTRFLLAIMTCAALTAAAQDRDKVGFPLAAYLDKHAAPDEAVDLFVHGEPGAVTEALRAHGGWVKMTRPGLVSARVPAEQVRAFAAHPAVKAIEFSFGDAHVLNDSMRVKNRIVPVQLGQAPLPQAYNGENVLIGMLDTGLDYDHPDFLDENGNTRILKYWDQTLPVNGQTPQPYGYGQVWESAAINAGLMTSIDQPGQNGHGTTVTGIAAGNGLANGRNMGVAPKADLIVVSLSFSGNFKAKVADAVKFVFDEAAALGRPIAANASVGSYLGSHDALDGPALFIDDLLDEQGGRALVCATGNSNNQAAYHMQTAVDADTSFTWFTRSSTGLGYQAVYFELWADTADFNDVHYAIGADRVSPSYLYRGRTPFHTALENMTGTITDTLWSLSGQRIGVVDYFLTPRDGQYLLQVHMQQPDSATYNYRFMTTGSGKFDVWSSSIFGTSNMIASPLPSPTVLPGIEHYVLPDKNKHMVDSWACSDKVITVANYYNEVSYLAYTGNIETVTGTEGAISTNSSKGPTRDERQKPDIAASGDITLTPAPLEFIQWLLDNNGAFKVADGGMHIRNGGTSMASPVVTGTVALYLQKCPTATASEIKAALTTTAFTDAFTGTAMPDNNWGYGKLDAYNALVTSMITGPVSIMGPEAFCAGDSVPVDATDGFASYAWSNGGAGDPLFYGGTGPLSVVARNAYGCTVTGEDTLYFVHWPLPPEPTIEVLGPVLTSSAATGYQWYLDGVAIPGATDQVHEATGSGEYHVVVSDANGCTAASGPVTVVITGLGRLQDQGPSVWPSPANDVLHVRIPSAGGSTTIALFDAEGRMVWAGNAQGDVTRIGLEAVASGSYTVVVGGERQRWSQRFVKLP